MKIFIVTLFHESPDVRRPTAAFTGDDEAFRFVIANHKGEGFSISERDLNPQWHTGPATPISTGEK